MSLSHLDRREIRRHFSDHADEYDRYAQVQKKVAAELVAMATVEPITGTVLDVGTGTGAVGARLRERCPGVPLIVSDLAHEMTSVARGNLPGAMAVDADARSLPFQEESFGLILSASVYQWVEDLKTAFQDNYRILQPGGRFAFALFSDGTLGELKEVFQQALHQCGSGRPFHFQSFPEKEVVHEALQEAGFGQVECTVKHEAEYHDRFRDLLIGLKKIGAQNATTNRPGGLFPRRVLQEMERLYQGYSHAEKGLRATYSVLYGVGQKMK